MRKAPEVGAGELHGAGRVRLDGQGEDRATQSRGIARREPSELSLSGWRELDATAAFAHASSGP